MELKYGFEGLSIEADKNTGGVTSASFLSQKMQSFAEGCRRAALSSALAFLDLNDSEFEETDEKEAPDFKPKSAVKKSNAVEITGWLRRRENK